MAVDGDVETELDGPDVVAVTVDGPFVCAAVEATSAMSGTEVASFMMTILLRVYEDPRMEKCRTKEDQDEDYTVPTFGLQL